MNKIFLGNILFNNDQLNAFQQQQYFQLNQKKVQINENNKDLVKQLTGNPQSGSNTTSNVNSNSKSSDDSNIDNSSSSNQSDFAQLNDNQNEVIKYSEQNDQSISKGTNNTLKFVQNQNQPNIQQYLQQQQKFKQEQFLNDIDHSNSHILESGLVKKPLKILDKSYNLQNINQDSVSENKDQQSQSMQEEKQQQSNLNESSQSSDSIYRFGTKSQYDQKQLKNSVDFMHQKQQKINERNQNSGQNSSYNNTARNSQKNKNKYKSLNNIYKNKSIIKKHPDLSYSNMSLQKIQQGSYYNKFQQYPSMRTNNQYSLKTFDKINSIMLQNSTGRNYSQLTNGQNKDILKEFMYQGLQQSDQQVNSNNQTYFNTGLQQMTGTTGINSNSTLQQQNMIYGDLQQQMAGQDASYYTYSNISMNKTNQQMPYLYQNNSIANGNYQQPFNINSSFIPTPIYNFDFNMIPSFEKPQDQEFDKLYNFKFYNPSSNLNQQFNFEHQQNQDNLFDQENQKMQNQQNQGKQTYL